MRLCICKQSLARIVPLRLKRGVWPAASVTAGPGSSKRPALCAVIALQAVSCGCTHAVWSMCLVRCLNATDNHGIENPICVCEDCEAA